VEAGTVKDTPPGICPDPVDVDVATCTPLYVTVKGEFGKKLDPDTVTLVPMGPLDGLSVREEATTVKVAEAALGTVSPA
jgi:hypothetical protein